MSAEAGSEETLADVTAGPKLDVVLCWHMHQPQYFEQASGCYSLPWTYLHAMKDYSDMAAHLEAVPGARAVVNFAPILLDQIADYAERIAAFLRLLVRIDEHAEKRPLSVLPMIRPEGSAKQARIATVIDHITQNSADDLGLEQMAEMAGMSATAFSRNFQKATGSGFVEFVNRVRIAQACVLLCATDEPVSGICFDVGFQNLANFNRRFLKMKQVTPTDYRASMRAGLMQKWKGTE
jgi:AraC-like DNA-binding protein